MFSGGVAMAEEDEDQTMELTIEALTGTVYDLCVSPYETILGIKMKIQRLEGIPVYQQQLVYGDTELQDENCLAEHGIPSGAQLKLLIAMRGGPIHAQRIQLDLEDPTLLEIAEILDSQGGDKYTVMLVRNTEDVDNASFVHVQMLNEDGRESISCSPLQVSDSHQRMGVVTSKVTQMEHDITRDKMKDLMAKLRKGRGYRHHPGHTPSMMAATSKASPSQLPRKGTAKVLILESRASSQLLHTPTKGSPLPVSHTNEHHRMPGAQRKLVFSGEHCSCCHHSSKRKSSRSLASKRTRSPEEETPVSSARKQPTRLKDEAKDEEAPGYSLREWRRTSKRLKRNSYIDSEPTPPQTKARIKTDADCVDGVRDLVAQVSQLALNPTSNDDNLCTLNSSLVGGASSAASMATMTTTTITTKQQRTGGGFLPHIPSGHKPISLTARAPSQNGRGSAHNLPPLTVSTTAAATPSIAQGKPSRKRNHCMQCGKKMGLATTYSCRCGGMFCALHRYAETHSCNFDYKAEGRRLIARNNPIVMAPKLPKI